MMTDHCCYTYFIFLWKYYLSITKIMIKIKIIINNFLQNINQYLKINEMIKNQDHSKKIIIAIQLIKHLMIY